MVVSDGEKAASKLLGVFREDERKRTADEASKCVEMLSKGVFKYLDERLGYYLRREYRNLWGHKKRRLRRLNQIAKENPEWLVHWQKFGRAMVG